MLKKTSKETKIFQSTLPVRGATEVADDLEYLLQISIHAPREGSDLLALYCLGCRTDFNPRSP